ncbi:sugar phosphate isomerase/epimerase family protein [Paenibacillus koleovorans]|uniref:sugar phosphate isomerase/epimerase family protein n=1 Tax=Paenibacillus koleovorans TaxID=121608 RepID=UPI0013E2F44C|nr:sugar phosphate isomerase/epimerase family protein [Paenibacillus koleovorans]
MNPLGIFNSVYRTSSLEEMARQVAGHGMRYLHLDPRIEQVLPRGEAITSSWARSVKRTLDSHGLQVAALAGYCNLVHHNIEIRESGLRTFEQLIEVCNDFGTSYIATETGGLHPEVPNMDYPANHSEAGWQALLEVLDRLVGKCKEHGVKLLIEGCVKYTVATPAEAVKVMEHYGEERIGFILDPNNYVQEVDLHRPQAVLADVFERLAGHAPIAHAKDVLYTEKGFESPKVGDGHMDHVEYARLLQLHTPDIPLIVEHLKPDEVPHVLSLLEQAFREADGAARR